MTTVNVPSFLGNTWITSEWFDLDILLLLNETRVTMTCSWKKKEKNFSDDRKATNPGIVEEQVERCASGPGPGRGFKGTDISSKMWCMVTDWLTRTGLKPTSRNGTRAALVASRVWITTEKRLSHRLTALQATACAYIAVRSLKALVDRGERTMYTMTNNMPMATYAYCFVTSIRSLQKVVPSMLWWSAACRPHNFKDPNTKVVTACEAHISCTKSHAEYKPRIHARW
jgi:hypothetical protein